MDDLLSSSKQVSRRRHKAHQKSRTGCRNCKLRKVKCDETKPACRSCLRFLVTCKYDSTACIPSASSRVVRDDDLSFSVSEINIFNNKLVTDFNRMVTSQYPPAWEMGQFRSLSKFDIDRLKRWHTRTVFTLGTRRMSDCYEVTVKKEATQRPYLLHAVLAMAAMHDGLHQASKDSGLDNSPATFYYHYSCAAALFNERLSRPSSRAADRNAIWATASILGNIASFSVPTCDPELSWPLTPSSGHDLEWMDMHKGIFIIYNLASPCDPGGMFHELMDDPPHKFLMNKWDQDTRDGIEGIPSKFVALCGLTPRSNSQNNPYHATVRALASIWDMESTQYTAFRFLSFLSLLRPVMKQLLMQKDARALLLLACWYTKMFHVHWWFQKRAVVECTAICIYLQRYHYSDALVMGMLRWPLSRLAEYGIGVA